MLASSTEYSPICWCSLKRGRVHASSRFARSANGCFPVSECTSSRFVRAVTGGLEKMARKFL